MDVGDLRGRAMRVLDAQGRPPAELPKDDPIRLLHEFVHGDHIGVLEGEIERTNLDAENAEADAAEARDESEELEEKLDDLRERVRAAGLDPDALPAAA